MLAIYQVDTESKEDIHRFVTLPYRLYKNCPQWVPPLFMDAELPLNRKKHPFYEHSSGDFFLALRDDRVVGRIAALENTRYNQYHGTNTAQFYFFDCENDLEAASMLFERAIEWAQKRGLNKLMGPKGFAVLDGYGMQVEGFEYRTIMTMMNYNYPYYPELMEKLGFAKEVDFCLVLCRYNDFPIARTHPPHCRACKAARDIRGARIPIEERIKTLGRTNWKSV
jgi:hypothetical protein